MNIDKKLIVSALEIYKAFLVKRDISEHDQTLEYTNQGKRTNKIAIKAI